MTDTITQSSKSAAEQAESAFGDFEPILNDLVRAAGIALDFAIAAGANPGSLEALGKAQFMAEVVEERAKSAREQWYSVHKEIYDPSAADED